MFVYMKKVIIFVALMICFVSNTKFINATGFEDFSLRSKSLTLNEGGIFYLIMKKEIWKEVPDYEGLYQASNKGNIKNSRRMKPGGKKKRLQNSGYLITDLCKNNIKKTCLVHRIIAKTFIPEVKNKLHTNHKNGIKTDNRAENLEWVTRSENQKHGYKLGLLTPRRKAVMQYDKTTDKLIQIYKSITEAGEKNNILISSISNNLTNFSKTSGGYVWKYFEPKRNRNNKRAN